MRQLAHTCHADREPIAEFLAPPLIGSADAALLKSSFFSRRFLSNNALGLEHPSRYSCEVVANKQSPREDTRDRGGGASVKGAEKNKRDLLLPYLIITNRVGAGRRYYCDETRSGFMIKNT